jgi:biotin carboxyl carrier protein
MNLTFWIDGEEFKLALADGSSGRLRAVLGEQAYEVQAEFLNPEEVLLNVDGRVYNVTISSNSLSHSVFVNGHFFRVEKRASLKAGREERGRLKKGDVTVSMPGRVVQVLAAEGEEVREGQPVLILEAMKMQNEIKSPCAGRLTRLGVRPGASIEAGAVLFSVE